MQMSRETNTPIEHGCDQGPAIAHKSSRKSPHDSNTSFALDSEVYPALYADAAGRARLDLVNADMAWEFN